MKKVRQIFALAFAFVSVMLMTFLTACAKESTVYLTIKSDDNDLGLLQYILIGVAAVIVILIVLKLIFGRKKEEEVEEGEQVVLTQDPNAVSEYIFEDEIVKEDAEEEKPAEEAAGEATEEKAEEPAEEATEEKADETVEEIAEEKAEEPAEEATEEKAVTEETVEEVADTSFLADNKSEAVEEEDPGYTLDANGLPVAPDGMVIRYKWSFLARLIQSDDELKYRYMMLRRKLLSYKKVRSNVSWNFDSYFIGRKPIVKLKVRGKTLVAYFPINPEEMKGTKYVGEDCSGISRYKAVPFAYRINGMRKLKYAIELIEKQLTDVSFKEPVYIKESEANEAIPRESFKKLYEKGYVRVGGMLPVGDRAAKDDDEDDDDVNIAVDEVEEEAEPSPLKEEFNFNPKAQ